MIGAPPGGARKWRRARFAFSSPAPRAASAARWRSQYAARGTQPRLVGPRRREARGRRARLWRSRRRGGETTIADVRDREDMARIVRSLRMTSARSTFVVANAGVATGLSSGQIIETPEAVRAMLEINVIGVFNTVEPAILPCAPASAAYRHRRLDGGRARASPFAGLLRGEGGDAHVGGLACAPSSRPWRAMSR